MSFFIVYVHYAKGRLGINVVVRRKPLNILFLAVLVINFILVLLVFKFYRTELQMPAPFVNRVTTDVLSSGEQFDTGKNYFVDFLSACAAALSAFAALLVGLRAMADRKNALSISKMACIFLVIASVEGMYYSNSLYGILFFNIMSQTASYGLYRHSAVYGRKAVPVFMHHLSRIVSMLLFLAGVVILSSKYGPSLTRLISCSFTVGMREKIAFALMFAPMAALFLRPATHTKDPVYRAFFVMRSQAVFYVIIRIIFSIFGVSAGLEKVPNIMIFTGCAAVLFSVLMTTSTKEPCKYSAFMDLFAKGFLLVSAGIAYYGCFSAEGLAQYGFTALESMISLWLLYLPMFTILTISSALIETPADDGIELYRKSGLLSITPVAVFALYFVLFGFCGMPPLVTYPFIQLIFRAANFIWPFLAVFLVLAVFSMFIIGLYMISTVAFGKAWTKEDKEKSTVRDREIILVTSIFMFWILLLSVSPGLLLQNFAAPSAESLMNTGYSINVIEEAEK
ncbi:MAG: hypothetical protein KBS54_01330 [Synergistaceae bacterium]|nr:hypothetical protein [Candidatus Equadaptatus faecalis]